MTTLRDKIVANCEWGIKNQAQIHYSMGPVRDDWLSKKARALPMTTDCSGFTTAMFKWAGAPDPCGLGYKWVGSTRQMLNNRAGRKVATPLPGDLIIYGEYPGHHVVIFMYVWHGAWVVCSHGQESGPAKELQHWEEVSQAPPLQIRSYLPRK